MPVKWISRLCEKTNAASFHLNAYGKQKLPQAQMIEQGERCEQAGRSQSPPGGLSVCHKTPLNTVATIHVFRQGRGVTGGEGGYGE